MPVSEKKKVTNQRWDAKNMTTLGCRMRRAKAEQFKAACKQAGTTVNAVYTRATDEFLAKTMISDNEEV